MHCSDVMPQYQPMHMIIVRSGNEVCLRCKKLVTNIAKCGTLVDFRTNLHAKVTGVVMPWIMCRRQHRVRFHFMLVLGLALALIGFRCCLDPYQIAHHTATLAEPVNHDENHGDVCLSACIEFSRNTDIDCDSVVASTPPPGAFNPSAVFMLSMSSVVTTPPYPASARSRASPLHQS